MGHLCDLELADHEDLLAHRGTGKSLDVGHLGDLELAFHEDFSSPWYRKVPLHGSSG